MSPPKKDSNGDYDNSDRGSPRSPNRQGRKDGGTPDYEKGQSSPIDDEDFDNEVTKW